MIYPGEAWVKLRKSNSLFVVNRVGNDLTSDPQWRKFIKTPPQFLRVEDFADSAVIIKILWETEPLKQWDVAGELRKRLKIASDKEEMRSSTGKPVVSLHYGQACGLARGAKSRTEDHHSPTGKPVVLWCVDRNSLPAKGGVYEKMKGWCGCI